MPDKFDPEHLNCYGCAHSASQAPPPGHPSGERPCMICIRAPELHFEKIAANNGHEIEGPKDMYIAGDRWILEKEGHQTHHPWQGGLTGVLATLGSGGKVYVSTENRKKLGVRPGDEVVVRKVRKV